MNVRLSRREVLQVAGGSVFGLGGCVARPSTTGDRESDTASPTARERAYSNVVEDPASATVRNSGGTPAVRSPAHPPEENVFESAAEWSYEDWLVTSQSGRDALDFAQGTGGVESATEFAAAVDFAAETLLVHQYRVGTCETRTPVSLRWRRTDSDAPDDRVGISVTYTQSNRESDCRDDGSGSDGSPPYDDGSYHSEATFVRIPEPVRTHDSFEARVVVTD